MVLTDQLRLGVRGGAAATRRQRGRCGSDGRHRAAADWSVDAGRARPALPPRKLQLRRGAAGAGHRRAGPRDPELPARQDGSDPPAPGPYGCTPTKRSGKPAGGCAATTMPGPAWDDRTVVADSQASDPMGSLALLRANRPLRLLWTARTVSFLGDSLSLVALMLYVADATGAALAVACSCSWATSRPPCSCR